MMNKLNPPALALVNQFPGVIHRSLFPLLLAASLLLFMLSGALAAQPPTLDLNLSFVSLDPPTPTNAAPATLATNSLVAEIQAQLKSMQQRMQTAQKQMQAAAHSQPAQYPTVVSNTAAQLRQFAETDLGDGSQILNTADQLLVRIKARLEATRADAKTANDALDAALYGKVLNRLGPQLGQMIDAKTSLLRMRSQLLKEAAALEAHAKALARAEEAEVLVSAAEAFQDVVREVGAFTVRLGDMIDNLGQPPTTFSDLRPK
jgi:hypothetical protein